MLSDPAAAPLLTILLALSAPAQDAQAPPAAPVSACPAADDPEYAFTSEKPIQVGGGPLYFAARQRRVLITLRGPEGQALQYKRVGTQDAPDGTTLDIYEVTYSGLDKPVRLYMDGYHFNEPAAPQGFACAAPIDLQPPGPDPFRTSRILMRVAIEQGAARQFTPIPLDADGTTTHGVVFDWFRRIALAARSAAATGKRLDPESPPRDLFPGGTAVVAYPRRCEERTIAPTAIAIVDQRERELRRDADYVKGDAVETLLPGVTAPAASLAAVFPLERPRPLDSVRITYAEACGPTSNQITLPFNVTPAKLVESPAPLLPEGAPAGTRPVLLQVLIDTDGAAQRPEYIGGPADLIQAAMDAIRQWRIEPPRLNGVPVVEGVTLQVTFTPR